MRRRFLVMCVIATVALSATFACPIAQSAKEYLGAVTPTPPAWTKENRVIPEGEIAQAVGEWVRPSGTLTTAQMG